MHALSTRFEKSGPASGPVVTGFAGRGFKVGDSLFAGGVTLTPNAAETWDAPPVGELGDHLDMLLALEPPPEFLLLGTGTALARPPRAFAAALDARGIGLEAMDSRAAARAWVVLRAEDRWIVAALMPL